MAAQQRVCACGLLHGCGLLTAIAAGPQPLHQACSLQPTCLHVLLLRMLLLHVEVGLLLEPRLRSVIVVAA
jgi:hypothetical protein